MRVTWQNPVWMSLCLPSSSLQRRVYLQVCPTEITAFSDRAQEFADLNCDILGVSVDSKYSHLAWIQTDRKVRHHSLPLASRYRVFSVWNGQSSCLPGVACGPILCRRAAGGVVNPMLDDRWPEACKQTLPAHAACMP